MTATNSTESSSKVVTNSRTTTLPSFVAPLPPMVILTPETHIYRRLAVIHTTPDDSFLEIGCDYGITVDKIRKSIEEGGCVTKVWSGNLSTDDEGGGVIRETEKLGLDDTHEENTEPISNMEENEKRFYCLGIDKSKESIDIATDR